MLLLLLANRNVLKVASQLSLIAFPPTVEEEQLKAAGAETPSGVFYMK